MKPLVIFHKNCLDGFGAAWVAYQKFGNEAEYYPMHYGDELPSVDGREVYILDFSFDKETTLQLIQKCAKIIWLDHHHASKSLAEELINAKDKGLASSLD